MNAILARSRWNFLPAKNLAENHWNLAEISPTTPRSRLSRRDDRDLGEISLNFHARKKSRRELLKFRRDLGYLAEISPISAISPRSRRDLAEIAVISPRSRWIFMPAKNLAENYWNLAEISVISPRSRLSRLSRRDLGEISLKFLQGKEKVCFDISIILMKDCMKMCDFIDGLLECMC